MYSQVPRKYDGLQTFIRRASLETPNYLKDDCLSMHCKVGIVREGFTFSIPPYDVTQNLRDLLETETGCDIVLCVGNQTFKAHKSILAARSPLFRAQLFGKNPNKMGDEVMLLFIYSDTLPDSMSTDIIKQLLAANFVGIKKRMRNQVGAATRSCLHVQHL